MERDLLVCPPRPPSNRAIQLCHVTKSDDVWIGLADIINGDEDLWATIGDVCPLCGRVSKECLKQITEYERWVADLFPLQVELVPIVRLRCTLTKKTISLLPHQLAPYKRYTVRTILYLLLLAQEFVYEGGSPLGKAVTALPGDCDVTSWLLRGWIKLALHGFARAHHVLATRYDLDGVTTGKGMEGELECIKGYCSGNAARGPPGVRRRLDWLVRWYTSAAFRHLLGTPSQERC